MKKKYNIIFMKKEFSEKEKKKKEFKSRSVQRTLHL